MGYFYCFNPTCPKPTVNTTNDRLCPHCGHELILESRWQGESLLGEGAFGRTVRAVDRFGTYQYVAVKVLNVEKLQRTGQLDEALRLFVREAEQLKRFGVHEQIPDYYSFGRSKKGFPFLAQEYIAGKTLDLMLKEGKRFAEPEVRRYVIELLEVLHELHHFGVFHRDIKPSNIIIPSRRASSDKAFLLDLGIARVTGVMTHFLAAGTPFYMAPEQHEGHASAMSDLYALGVTAIHLFLGNEGWNAMLRDPTPEGPPERVQRWRKFLSPQVTVGELGPIIDRLVQPAVKKRYSSAKKVLQELHAPVPALSVHGGKAGGNKPTVNQQPATPSTPQGRGAVATFLEAVPTFVAKPKAAVQALSNLVRGKTVLLKRPGVSSLRRIVSGVVKRPGVVLLTLLVVGVSVVAVPPAVRLYVENSGVVAASGKVVPRGWVAVPVLGGAVEVIMPEGVVEEPHPLGNQYQVRIARRRGSEYKFIAYRLPARRSAMSAEQIRAHLEGVTKGLYGDGQFDGPIEIDTRRPDVQFSLTKRNTRHHVRMVMGERYGYMLSTTNAYGRDDAYQRSRVRFFESFSILR